MVSLSISIVCTRNQGDTRPRYENVMNRLKQIHTETRERNPKGFMDELEMRLGVHMMDIAAEMACTVIMVEDMHFVFNFTGYDDEDVEKVVKQKGTANSLTIDFREHFTEHGIGRCFRESKPSTIELGRRKRD